MANTCGRRSGWLLSSLLLEEDADICKPSRTVLRLLLLLHGCQGSITGLSLPFIPPLDSCCWIVEIVDLLCAEVKHEVEKAAVTEANIERRRMPPSPPMLLLPPDEDDLAAAAVQGAARSNVGTAAVAVVMAVSQHDNTT